MAQYNRIDVVLEMERTGIVPVFYDADINTCKQVLKACYDGGIRVFEFTNRGDFAHEIFAELNKFALSTMPGLILGIGSIVEPATAGLYMQLGANFIISPLVNEDVAKTCNRRKVAWIPGCATLSEISQAEELGAEVVKLFPAAQVGGPDYVKAVKAPCPWTRIMPTGGVSTDAENLKAWFGAGVHCVGIGSNLFVKTNGQYDYPAITAKVQEALKTVSQIRGNV
ncbi:MAG TPA: bifunctional 4-hydroxy-2-oxoglutarate aldolase/2-dehydro-3-deoxy-phosphogluconate aldolase [Flavobacteriaceae bacterium]|nr:bifunctional 4-hydroxy-2-oxoglutarate aldolase/2-dehydro-3-deoxy-phosphogluconate aldolase [Flavobacteriaceae bacterium]